MAEKSKNIVPQAGVIPFCVSENEYHIMLITTKKQNRWIVPKGNIEKSGPEKSAAMEAYEEAGIEGKILIPAGNFTYEKAGMSHNVGLYYFEIKKVLKKWPESRSRLRRLVTVEQAEQLLSDPKVIRMIKKLPTVFKRKQKIF